MLLVFLACGTNNFDKDYLTFELRLVESEADLNPEAMALYNSDLRFTVADSLFLTNEDLVTAEVVDKKNQPKVKVILNEEGRQKFADFTLKNIGRNAALIVDGQLVSAPRINAQIDEGILLIVGHIDLAEAESIARGIMPKH